MNKLFSIVLFTGLIMGGTHSCIGGAYAQNYAPPDVVTAKEVPIGRKGKTRDIIEGIKNTNNTEDETIGCSKTKKPDVSLLESKSQDQ